MAHFLNQGNKFFHKKVTDEMHVKGGQKLQMLLWHPTHWQKLDILWAAFNLHTETVNDSFETDNAASWYCSHLSYAHIYKVVNTLWNATVIL